MLPPLFENPGYAGIVGHTLAARILWATATLVVPPFPSSLPPNALTALWVGVGVQTGSRNLCQAGVVATTDAHGRLALALMGEDWPAAPHGWTGVHPGDRLEMLVGRVGNRWLAEVRDPARGQTLVVPCRPGPWSTVGWIAETWTWRDGQPPLLPAQPAVFTACTVHLASRIPVHWSAYMIPGVATPAPPTAGRVMIRWGANGQWP